MLVTGVAGALLDRLQCADTKGKGNRGERRDPAEVESHAAIHEQDVMSGSGEGAALAYGGWSVPVNMKV